MSATKMRALSKGLIGTTAVVAAGLSGLYMRNASAKSPSVVPLLRTYSSSATPPFTYRLAAAASAKQSPPRAAKAGRDFHLYSSTHANTSPPYIRSTKPDAGEDAFFMATVGASAHHVAFGVADGVGGWQDSGVDPSDFSHGLCGLMAGTAHIYEGVEEGKVPRAQDLMQTAYDAVIGNPRILAGGCTASLGVLDGHGQLDAAK
jgi:protein phosphatase PTC7